MEITADISLDQLSSTTHCNNRNTTHTHIRHEGLSEHQYLEGTNPNPNLEGTNPNPTSTTAPVSDLDTMWVRI